MLRGKHSLNTIWEEHPLNNRPFAKHPISLQPASSGICQLGGYDHSVLYTSAQLTEGRSARDQPKQPPAKKNNRLPVGRTIQGFGRYDDDLCCEGLHLGSEGLRAASVSSLT